MSFNTDKYQLIDCGDGFKLEQFGEFRLKRPCPQAVWKPFQPELWNNIDAEFERTNGEKGKWVQFPGGKKLPQTWHVQSPHGLTWLIEPNDFGNLGVFTEHWVYAPDLPHFFAGQDGESAEFYQHFSILNVFTYSGSNCVNLAQRGFPITAVDSSKTAMTHYTTNLELNQVDRKGQRLVLEDALKFMKREARREKKYAGIMIDAPSYGRGTKGEIFSIEEHLRELVTTAQDILADNGKMILTLHSPRFTPAILNTFLTQMFPKKTVSVQEIINQCQSGAGLPSGFLARIG